MSVSSGQTITQADLNTLAGLANTNLLPLVNAAINSATWPATFYDITNHSGGALISPQPDYNFAALPNSIANLIPAGSVYDGSGNFTITVTADSFYNFEIGLNDTGITIGGFSFTGSQREKRSLAVTTAIITGTPSAAVTAALILSAGWVTELNRIRTDYFNLIFTNGLGADDLYESSDNILSGPWCVGVNDPVTYPLTALSYGDASGELFLENGNYPGFPLFLNVQFWFSKSDVNDGFSIGIGRRLDYDISDDINYVISEIWPVMTISYPYTIELGGQLNGRFTQQFTGAAGAAPDPSIFNIDTSESDLPITFTTEIDPVLGAGNFLLIGTISEVASSSTGTIKFSFQGTSDYPFPLGPIVGSRQQIFIDFLTTMEIIFSSNSTQVSANAILPSVDAAYIAIDPIPNDSGFTIVSPNSGSAIYGVPIYKLSDGTTPGVWIAKTLPIPGQNVFLDNAMPPFVQSVQATQETANGGTVTVAVALQSDSDHYYDQEIQDVEQLYNASTLEPEGTINRDTYQDGIIYPQPLTTTMRSDAWFLDKAIQIPAGQILIDPDGKVYSGTGPQYRRHTMPSIRPQPAQFLARRDTDFVPFNFGYNANDFETITPSQTAPANGSILYYIFLVPAGATSVKIRLNVQGTSEFGWQNGAIVYGTIQPTPLTIYVSKSVFHPTPSNCDFSTTNNQVNIPTDGGIGYITAIAGQFLYFGVAIPNVTGTTQPVPFEILIVNETTATPVRQYFPPVNECFSNNIDGRAPGTSIDEYWNFSKPIPQSGYSIFKIRARRKPLANAAGIEVIPATGGTITVTVGQNKLNPETNILTFVPFLQSDGMTPFTVTIEATAADSGFVDVFWPVLAGNEVVWQCDTPILFDCWANWQPIWFTPAYAVAYQINLGFSPGSNPYAAMFFSGCLAFGNSFDYSVSLLAPPPNFICTPVVFPFSKEIYNELESCLNLI